MSKPATVAAIVGQQQCGKTSLVRVVSRLEWLRHKRRSLVFDPWCGNWGPWAWVTDDKERFLRAAFGVHGCAVIWDESTDSMDKCGKMDRGLFTRLREREVRGQLIGHPSIYVVSHDYASLAPVMRSNLNAAFIFLQNEDRAKDWARQFADRDLLQCSELQQYEFLVKRSFQPVRRVLPASPAELERYL